MRQRGESRYCTPSEIERRQKVQAKATRSSHWSFTSSAVAPKVEIALAKGKAGMGQRQSLREAQDKREVERAMRVCHERSILKRRTKNEPRLRCA